MGGLINNTTNTVYVVIGDNVGYRTIGLPPGGQIGGTNDTANDVDGYWGPDGNFYKTNDASIAGPDWHTVSGGSDPGVKVTPNNPSFGYHSSQPDTNSLVPLITDQNNSNSYQIQPRGG